MNSIPVRPMFRPRRVGAALLLALALAVLPATAQRQERPTADAKAAKTAQRERGKRSGGGTGELRQTVMLLYIDGLRRNLKLTDEKTLELLPLFEEMENLREKHGEEYRAAMEKLAALAANEAATDRDIEQVITSMAKGQGEFRVKEDALKARIDGKLTVRQRAQLVLFHARFQKRLRDIVERRRLAGRDLGFEKRPWLDGEPQGPGKP